MEKIVRGTILAYPVRFAISSAKETLLQLASLRTGDEIRSYGAREWNSNVIPLVFPGDLQAFINGREYRDRLTPLADDCCRAGCDRILAECCDLPAACADGPFRTHQLVLLFGPRISRDQRGDLRHVRGSVRSLPRARGMDSAILPDRVCVLPGQGLEAFRGHAGNRGVGSTRWNEWCRRRDSNSRPRDYETLALPLSYTGKNKALHVTDAFQGLSSRERAPESGQCLVQAGPNWDKNRRSSPPIPFARSGDLIEKIGS